MDDPVVEGDGSCLEQGMCRGSAGAEPAIILMKSASVRDASAPPIGTSQQENRCRFDVGTHADLPIAREHARAHVLQRRRARSATVRKTACGNRSPSSKLAIVVDAGTSA
jgi:hypothetical protein